MSGHVHTIPVDPSLTADEAWGELCIFGRRITDSGSETWAVVECDGQECQNFEVSQDYGIWDLPRTL